MKRSTKTKREPQVRCDAWLEELEAALRIVHKVEREQWRADDALHWPTEKARKALWNAVDTQRRHSSSDQAHLSAPGGRVERCPDELVPEMPNASDQLPRP